MASSSGSVFIQSSSSAWIAQSSTKADDGVLEREADALKEAGNDLFKLGKYAAAIEFYKAAIAKYAPKPVYSSNLAMAYLKLNLYSDAEAAATQSLLYDPKLAKARYRRALARRGLGKINSAIQDLHVIVKNEESRKDALEMLEALDALNDAEEDQAAVFPAYDAIPKEIRDRDARGSEEGKTRKVACRFFNHGGCRNGDKCRFSHVPDDRSVRDDRGRNVCIFHLTGSCNHGSKCPYAHDTSHLGDSAYLNAFNYKTKGTSVTKAKAKRSTANYTPWMEESFNYEYMWDSDEKERFYTTGRGGFSGLSDGRYDIYDEEDEEDSEDEGRVAFEAGPGNQVLRTLNCPNGSCVHCGGSNSRPLTLCISIGDTSGMFNKSYAPEIKALHPFSSVVQAFTPDAAWRVVSTCTPVCIWVTDAGITLPPAQSLARGLKEWVTNGGRIVFSAMFSSFVRPLRVEPFFTGTFGLPWSSGSYHRENFLLNPAHFIAKRSPPGGFVKEYCMKALHLGGVRPDMVVYMPKDTSIGNVTESPAVCAKIGKGSVGYIGDVNGEGESIPVLLAMLDLGSSDRSKVPPQPKTPQPPVASSHSIASSSRTQEDSLKPSLPSHIQDLLESDDEEVVNKPGPDKLTSRKLGCEDSVMCKFCFLPIPDPRPLTVIISLGDTSGMFNEIHQSQIAALHAKTLVMQTFTVTAALDTMANPALACVYVADAGIVQSAAKPVVQLLKRWAEEGGHVVFGGLFSSFIRMDRVLEFFQEAFGLPWQSASYTRTDFKLIPNHFMAKLAPSGELKPRYSMKALHLQGFTPESVVYAPVGTTPSGNGRIMESPVVCAKVGRGSVGYIGDVNAESETTPVLLAMLDMLEPGKPTPIPLTSGRVETTGYAVVETPSKKKKKKKGKR